MIGHKKLGEKTRQDVERDDGHRSTRGCNAQAGGVTPAGPTNNIEDTAQDPQSLLADDPSLKEEQTIWKTGQVRHY